MRCSPSTRDGPWNVFEVPKEVGGSARFTRRQASPALVGGFLVLQGLEPGKEAWKFAEGEPEGRVARASGRTVLGSQKGLVEQQATGGQKLLDVGGQGAKEKAEDKVRDVETI